MITEIKREFNNIGEKITITAQLKYEDLEVYELPESCHQCPVGFMSHGCGREIPLTPKGKGRPSTCKLKKVSIPMPNLYEREEK